MADTLSRKAPDIGCNEVAVGVWKLWDPLKEEIERDEFIKEVVQINMLISYPSDTLLARQQWRTAS